MKSVTLSLALLTAGLTLPSPDASADDLYYAAFQGAIPSLQALHTGQSASSFQSTFNALTGGNQRLTSLETYYDSAGIVRYDSSYNLDLFGGSDDVIVGVPGPVLESLHGVQLAQGRHMTHMASYLHVTGERYYTAAYKASGGNQILKLGMDAAELQSTFDAFQLPPFFLAPSVFESWIDTHGTRRYDVAFSPAGSQQLWVTWGQGENGFLSTHASQQAQGRKLTYLEIYRTDGGALRYAGRWSNQAPSPLDPFLVLAETRSQFLVTVQDEINQGNSLIALAVLEDATLASTTEYGAGLAGTSGVPELSLDDEPYLGRSLNVNVENTGPAVGLAGVFLGLSAASLPFKGGLLLVSPDLPPLILPLQPGLQALPATMPYDAILDGVAFYAQLAVQDPGALNGVALSRGLAITLGQND